MQNQIPTKDLYRSGENLYLAFQLLDVPFHHIHSHPSAGNICDSVGCRKARFKDKVINLILAQ